jgi:antirestriction protein ArdC
VLWKPAATRDKESGEERTYLLLRYFRVFNVEQCDRLELEAIPAFEPDLDAEQVYAGYPEPPSLAHGAQGAWYMPGPDHVEMPAREAFESQRAYYTTLFHELTHSTGHRSRLNRAEVVERNGFGSEPYSREELVAEIGAGMLAAAVGIEPDYQQSAAYITSWLAALKNDRKLVVSAAARAQRAADWILDRTEKEASE